MIKQSLRGLMNPVLEKQTQHFIDAITSKKSPPIYKFPVKDARKLLETVQTDYPVQKLPIKTHDLELPCGPSGKISVRIFRPSNGNGKLPVVMYFHGGGWILGSYKTHDRLIREIAYNTHAAVVFVNFSPAPETRYPVAIEEAYAATKYIAEHGKQLKLDSNRLAVAGDSAGGNMATIVALLAAERAMPKIDCQVLFYPVTDANFKTHSYQDFAEGPWLTKPAMEWFWNAYAPKHADRKNPHVCPLQASLEQLKKMPPTLLITAENDVLRDEGEAYAKKLMQAGVEVTVIRYIGTIHDFVLLNALSETPAAKNAIAQANLHLQKAFALQKTATQTSVA